MADLLDKFTHLFDLCSVHHLGRGRPENNKLKSFNILIGQSSILIQSSNS